MHSKLLINSDLLVN